MDNVLVSIIVPIYNVEKYLDDCITSILNQSYENLDIILVDDESPDNCPGKCDDYAKIDSRIRVIHKKNGGLGFARNSGLDIAKGKYVMFVDSDDYLNETAVETLIKYANEHDAQYVKAAFRKVNDSKAILYEKKQPTLIFDKKGIEYDLTPRMLGSSPSRSDSIEMSVWATLYDLDIINSNNLRFDSERIIVSEDLPFNITYLGYCQHALLVSDRVYNYRYNPNSLTEKYVKDKFNRMVDFFDQIQNRFPELTSRESTRLSRLFFVYLRKYINLELLNPNGSTLGIIEGIQTICANPKTISTIKNYPVKELPIKQRFFIYLVHHNLASILFLCSKLRLM